MDWLSECQSEVVGVSCDVDALLAERRAGIEREIMTHSAYPRPPLSPLSSESLRESEGHDDSEERAAAHSSD